jgi:hypothetical protein
MKANGIGQVLLAACTAASLTACGSGNDEDQIGQMSGDAMANFDDASQGGSFAAFLRTPGPLKAPAWERAFSALIPEAYAASCTSVTFGQCSAGVRTRTFSGCNVGSLLVSGTVTLTFSDPLCGMTRPGASVTRNAAVTFAGPNGGTYDITSPGGGQTITVNPAANGFSYSVGGIDRVATRPNGDPLFDISSSTTQDIGVTGTTRQTRVMNGGTLEVVHNLRKYTVDLTPGAVTWNGTCNCAVSGSWSGTASGTVSGSFAVDITGCGTATVTVNGNSQPVELDRCASL